MSRAAGGEQQATWDLHELAEPYLCRMLRSEARRVNAWISEDEVYELSLDAAMELAHRAASWTPGGALPWVWARQRITALVHQHLGQFTRELDDSHDERPEPMVVVHVEEPRAALRALAVRHSGARLLEQRLDTTVTERDAEIWLGFQIERAAGNRSPAVTVGTDHGLKPATVRKVVQRVSERLAVAA